VEDLHFESKGETLTLV